ncbi:hypothetical protein TPA0906_65970 [Streptomyces olivaceus]|uniref:hypothetical protein n=1 Tax=Streptomyces olivaceus TaxID=47716 RepID=UPI0022EDFB54|nr:hypothetical protein [Streptomyces olivaceus]GHJ04732.1 hypothetical protein TPA0906_65970 [Streptomyces olivaceus]
MNGPQHYREGERHLSAASILDKPGGKPVDPSLSMFHLQAAQAHFAAARTAAEAAQLADRYVGDGPHINDWRRATDGTPGTPGGRLTATETPYIPGQPYAMPVESALANLNLTGHITPADTLAAAIPVIAGHVAEALVESEADETRRLARGLIDELKRAGLDLRGPVEQRVEELNGGTPFSYDTPTWNDDPPF